MPAVTKEQIVFAGAAAMLLVASLSAVRPVGRQGVPGPQFVEADWPAAGRRTLSPLRELSEYTVGGRTPFVLPERHSVKGAGFTVVHEVAFEGGREDFIPGGEEGASARDDGDDSGGTVTLPDRPGGDVTKVLRGLRPGAWRIPVKLAGVYITGERRHAILRDETGGRFLRLVEGESYPRLGFSVFRVTAGTVELESEAGRRFPLRDLLREIRARSLKD